MTPRPTVSIVVPAFNEEGTILQTLTAIRRLPIDAQVIVVDDASTDSTAHLLDKNPKLYDWLITNTVNRGKGWSLCGGIQAATGDIIAFQDADSEYSPLFTMHAINRLRHHPEADIVYGSRFMTGALCRNISLSHRLANNFLTALVNILTGASLTDIETGVKAFRREVLTNLSLKEDRFAIEPEITIKALRAGARIMEIPITYKARGSAGGAKIRFKDGIEAIVKILKYSIYDKTRQVDCDRARMQRNGCHH